MTRNAAVITQCFELAASACGTGLGHSIDRAVLALQAQEGQSAKLALRDEYALAWRELTARKAAWCQRYAEQMRHVFQVELDAGSATTPTTAAIAPTVQTAPTAEDAPELSLVDDHDVAKAIASARLLQNILPMVETPLAEFDALISSALGLSTVQVGRNPMRPELFTQVLEAQLAAMTVAAPLRDHWLQTMAEPLGQEMASMYRQLNELLNQAQVQPASYRLVPSVNLRRVARPRPADGSAAASGMSDTDPSSAGDSTHALLPAVESVDPADLPMSSVELREFLLQRGDPPAQGLAESYYTTVENALTRLQANAYNEPAFAPSAPQPPSDLTTAPVDRPFRPVHAQSQLQTSVWGAYARWRERELAHTLLQRDATQVSQVRGLEVVRQVVQLVAQEPRLLAPVREAIVALEPSLLRLALQDPRFLRDAEHPGRSLLEAVAQRSFHYNDEFSAAFTDFMGKVAQHFNRLNENADANSEAFSQALTGLQADWAEQDRDEPARREQLLNTLTQADRRQSLADEIAWDLSQRSDLDGAPAVVLDFLYGPWALVMAQARLSDQGKQIDPGGFGGLVSDLLWSSKKPAILKNPAKLIGMIPGLLKQLHEGLALLGQDAPKYTIFFEALMTLHRPVLRLRRAKLVSEAKASDLAALDTASTPLDTQPATLVSPIEPVEPESVWLKPEELQQTGFVDIPLMDSAGAPLDSDATAAKAPPARAQPVVADQDHPMTAYARQQLQSLTPGTWVDLFVTGQWRRARLRWASQKGTLFMFISQGGQPHTMTQRSCERLIRQRLLRPVQSQAVVGQALDTLFGDTPAPIAKAA